MKRGNINISMTHTNKVNISVSLSDDGNVWMRNDEIAAIFDVTSASVNRQINKIFASGELDRQEVSRQEIRRFGNRRCYVDYYNLEMIAAVSLRLDSLPCIFFRRWIYGRIIKSLQQSTMIPIILRTAYEDLEMN